MPSNLVIVESPAKINKLQSFLGRDYIVMASYGHFRDLDPDDLSVDLSNDFKPNYILTSEKQKKKYKNQKDVVKEWKSLMKKCHTVYLASDFDREGEAIAWHIKEVLKLNATNSRRIVFTEITKTAILNAIDNPTTINDNMFYAQQARRILDRIIGYLISPILWKQIQSSYTQAKSLSAGRVQSVVVKLVMDREEEIKKFESSPYFKITGNFLYENATLSADLNKEKEITSLEESQKILEFCQEADFWIDDVKTRHTKRQPPLPFITSSLQQEASQKLSMSPKDTMSIAQKLYEKGKITYMRTDSLVLSEEAHEAIKKRVESEFGKEFYQKNKKTVGSSPQDDKKKKSKKSEGGKKGKKEDNNNAQEAHEACRPTDFTVASLSDASISNRENRLYKLIWSRTVMSQMKPAECDITSVKIKMKQGESVHKYHFVSKKEVITFLGYLKVIEYMKSFKNKQEEEEEPTEDNEEKPAEENILTEEIKEGKSVSYQKIQAEEKLTKPPQPHYQEASLIKKLDELGIGRPSTYATMITNVQERCYVEKKTIKPKEKEMNKLVLEKNKIKSKKEKVKIGGEKDKLFPTNLGEIVNRFLIEHFPEILDYKFTAHLENQLDEVAQGNVNWVEVVGEIYEKIKPKLEEMNVCLTKEKDKYKRELGVDPQTGATLTTYIGKYGPVVKYECEVTDTVRFSPLGDLKMETVTLEEALKLFAYPKILGEYRKKEVSLCKGQYGFYLRYNKKNVSIPKPVEGEEPEYIPEEITLSDAKKIISDLSKQPKAHTLEYEGVTITVKKGPYGPYFNYQGKNYSIYKTYDADNLTAEDVKKIVSYKKGGKIKTTSTKAPTTKAPNTKTKETPKKKIKKTNTQGEKKKEDTKKKPKKKVVKKTKEEKQE